MNPEITAGMVVVCVNDEGVEDQVRVNHFYLVENVLKEGLFVRLVGVEGIDLGAFRFEPVHFDGDHWTKIANANRGLINARY